MAGNANDLTLKVGFDIDRFNTELNKTTNRLNQWGNNITSQLRGLAAGFGGLALGKFALDAAKLAGEAEGVRVAFEKLPNSIRLMMDLKQATANTVSELDLMKRAVQASNFGISMQALPKLLEFAALRAQQTGESVDYLVNSIVTGIGRKSLLILDNLGISSVRINEELKKTPDYAQAIGNIAAQELEKMGTMADNAATKAERLASSFENAKISLGNAGGPLGFIMDGLADGFDVMAAKNLNFAEKIIGFALPSLLAESLLLKETSINAKKAAEEQKKHAKVIEEVDRAMASGKPEAYIEAQKQHVYYTDILAEYTSRLKGEEDKRAASLVNITNLTARLTELQEFQKIQTGSQLVATNQEIKSIQEKIKALKELGTVQMTQLTAEEEVAKRLNAHEKGISGAPVSPFEKLGNDLDNFANKAAETINSKMVPLNAPIIDFQKNLEQLGLISIDMGNMAAAGVASFAEAFGSAIGGGEDFGKSMTLMLLNFTKQFGEILIANGFGALALKKLMVNPVTAIAAGTALVAMASAAQARVSKAAASVGSGGGGGGGISGSAQLTPVVVQQGQRIEITGEFKTRGPDLVATLTNQNRRSSVIKGG